MKNALDKIAQLAGAAAVTRSEQDLALWRKWKASRASGDLSKLLDQMNPLIQREVSKWSATLARPLLEAEGKRLAAEAFGDYDASRGAALGTHVATRLQKMSRLSYSNQNVARLPENKILMFHTFNVAHSKLEDQFGRAPTSDELADELGWSMKHLTQFRKQTAHQERLESGGNEETGGSGGSLFEAEEADHTVDFIHHDLPPMQKAIFEHLTGYAGTKVLSNQEIQKKLGLTQGQYSYVKKRLVDHIEGVTAGRR